MTNDAQTFTNDEDIAVLQGEIAAQELAVRRFERERDAAAAGADRDAAEEADYRLIQARRYLDELLMERSALAVGEAAELPKRLQPRSAPRAMRAVRSGLAVVIGHSPQGDKGARGLVPPLPGSPSEGSYEYYWNREVAEWIKQDLTARGVRCEIFHRYKNRAPGILEAYREAIAWGPEASVELHFNAATGSARGTETLYELGGSLRWAKALQDALVGVYGRSGKLDRKVKLASANGRGKLSVIQIEPSALIEPFFGDNPADAELGVANKRKLASAIADAFAAYVGATPGAGTPPPAAPQPQPLEPAPTPQAPLSLWDGLRAAYSAATIEFPQLKGISFAQWALESGWGTSSLARNHLNFGGMKWRDFLADIAVPVDYTDSGGRRDKYCKFNNFQDFFQGYWRRFDNISNYDGWRNHTATPESYFGFIADIYAPPSENPSYRPRVLSIYERLKRDGKLPTETAPPAPPAQPSAPAGAEPPATTTPPVSAPAPAAASADALLAAVRKVAPPEAGNFVKLAEAYLKADIAHPALKLVTLAQWALESSWGRSPLAQAHYNFAGMEWVEGLKAAPVEYTPSGGTSGLYCRFLTLADFIAGYWTRLDTEPRFAGWKTHIDSSESFLRFLAPLWRPSETNYVAAVSNILNRFERNLPEPASPQVSQPAPAPADAAPAPSGPPATQIATQGFVIRINRVRAEQRRGRGHARTVGLYQAYFNGEPLAELQGVAYERQGPGDNTTSGRTYARRVSAGTYPLYTQAGQKYVTYGYSSGSAYPRPGILLANTGARVGILFHPGSGYLSSIGCINLSRALGGADEDLGFGESRARVIAMIDGMKQMLGDRFPMSNGKLIPDTCMVIEGEPAMVRAASERRARHLGEEAPAAMRGAEEPLSSGEAYDLVAATMNAEVLAERVNLSLFERLTAGRGDLKDLRNDDGENLWRAWAAGWQASFAIADLDEQARVRSELLEIARRLRGAEVDVNDDGGRRTPLTAAAVGNQWEAVAALHEMGAELDRRDRSGDSPLTAAAFHGAVESIEYLIGAGADPGLATSEVRAPHRDVSWASEDGESCLAGSTPLDCARAGAALKPDDPARGADYARIAALLIQAGGR